MRELVCVGDLLLKYTLVQSALVIGAVASAFFAPYGPILYVYFCVAVASLGSTSSVDVKIYPFSYYYATFLAYVAVSVGLSLYLTCYADSAKIIGRFVIEHSVLPERVVDISIHRMSALLSDYANVEKIYGWLSACFITPVLLLSIRSGFLRSYFSYIYREIEVSNNDSVIDQRKSFYIGLLLMINVMFGYAYILNYIYPVNGKHRIIDVIGLFRGGENVIIALNSAIYFSTFLLSLMSVAIFMAYNNKSKMKR